MSDDGTCREPGDWGSRASRIRSDGASPAELFRVLAHEWRRRTLASLRDSEGTMQVTELAAAVTDAADGATPARREEVATSLYHVHLPKLIDAGLVEWADPGSRDAVVATAEGRSLPTELSWLPAEQRPDGE
ncbi:MAG: hypothetical protein ABEJ31_11600 [Haloarculaceae archaeon]